MQIADFECATCLIFQSAIRNLKSAINFAPALQVSLTMIFIAGVSPKIKVLDQNPRRCPICGLHQAYYKRTDHYFSLFFIPIFRVKKGEPFIGCDRCEQAAPGMRPDAGWKSPEGAGRCKYCGQDVSGDFKFCPYCGKRI
jgi:hypothetical protein